MRIGVVSDTHGGLDGWNASMDILSGSDFILHAGDILNHGPINPFPKGHNTMGLIEKINTHTTPILIAKGNCDSEVDEFLLKVIIQPTIFIQDGNLRILIHHGHTHDDEGRIGIGKRYRLHIIISGHTHSPRIEERDGIVLMNPGSPSIGKILSCGEIHHKAGIVDIKIYDLKGNPLQEHTLRI